MLILVEFLSESLAVLVRLEVPAVDFEKVGWDWPSPSEKEFLWRARRGEDMVWEPRVFLASFKGEEGPLLIIL